MRKGAMMRSTLQLAIPAALLATIAQAQPNQPPSCLKGKAAYAIGMEVGKRNAGGLL